MKTKLISAALAALLTTASGAAMAQTAAPSPPRPHGGGLFMHADANKDGIVTRAELLADVDARFAKHDANKDGKITADERRGPGGHGRRMRGGPDGPPPPGAPGPEGPHARRGAPADANNDGAVTLDEARAQALKVFGYVDRNNDGKIDKAEREAFRDAAMALRGPGGPGPRGHRGHRGHGGHGRHAPPPAGAPEAPPGQ